MGTCRAETLDGRSRLSRVRPMSVCGRPRETQEILKRAGRVVRCFRVSGLLMRPLHGPLACMEFADRVQVAFARSRRLDIFSGFPDPVSPTVAPYPSVDLPTSSTASSLAGLSRRGRSSVGSRRAPSAPRRSAPSCWPARPPPACAASWRACARARVRRAPLRRPALAAELAPRIRSRRRLRSPIFEVRPSRSLPPLEC